MISTFLKSLESRLILLTAAAFFRLALELSYTDFVHPIYGYAGFDLIANDIKYAESWLLYFGLLTILPAKVYRPSDYLMCVCFFIFMTPLLVFYGLADPKRWMLYCVVLQYAIISIVRLGRSRFVFAAPQHGSQIALSLSILVIVVATAWMLGTAGLANFNLDLDAVYDFREEANEAIYDGFMGYIVIWATTVASPFVLMLALRDKKYPFIFGIFLLHVFWFGISSHKAVLFYPVLVLSLYALFNYSRAMALVPFGLTLVVGISLISYYITESLFLSGTFTRRVFFVPSHLTFTYFEFFSTNDLVYWSNSFLSWLIHYPYTESVALVIGNHLNINGLWANNSFFSTGYMHAGVTGVVVYGIATGLIMQILDSSSRRGIPIWMSLSLVIVPFNNLFNSSDLTTALLTHGLGFGLFVLYLIGDRSEQRKQKSPAVLSTLRDGKRIANWQQIR